MSMQGDFLGGALSIDKLIEERAAPFRDGSACDWLRELLLKKILLQYKTICRGVSPFWNTLLNEVAFRNFS